MPHLYVVYNDSREKNVAGPGKRSQSSHFFTHFGVTEEYVQDCQVFCFWNDEKITQKSALDVGCVEVPSHDKLKFANLSSQTCVWSVRPSHQQLVNLFAV